ncbi:hypothetical protein AMIS_80760 [Actinoplanes missouriensis 431]|uniref:Integral membrane protein n=1 Tax=Actinoplanes missouriensis (strain ATCC 14538 / DSM 43046 / CBS 188.64 / JCM 3121 / NBRC 102363 / NCIMB 12654 / NRRL B-3342 / UNCC 431) TaxID=512565 RepID=I0HJV9_ACTM4|nr:hypothetical protein AMIS_80760 [Actinoplanes missouriensis 431]
MPAIEMAERCAARRRSVRLALGGLATLLLLTLCFQRYGLSTLDVELAAIRSWIVGDGLYAYRESGTQAGAALSPALALLIAPLAVVPLPVAGWLLALAGLGALLVSLMVLTGPIARRFGRARAPMVLALAAAALLTGPVRATIGLGRVDLLLFALIMADLVALRRAAWARSRWRAGRPVRGIWWPGHAWSNGPPDSFAGRARRIWRTGSWAGAGIGLATALAPGPVLLIVYLLVSRQRRAAFTALATAVVVTLCAAVSAPGETMTWYGSTLWELDRTVPISDPGNQSLAGALARLYGFTAPPVLVWASFGVLLLAVGLVRARSAHGDGDETAAFALVGLAGAAAGPVTAPGEAIWLLPAVLILADEVLRRRWGGRLPRSRFTGAGFAVLGVIGCALLVADPFGAVTWNGYALLLILLVNALPWRHDSRPALPSAPARRLAAIPVPRGAPRPTC